MRDIWGQGGWQRALRYGGLLALGTAVLHWLDYRWLARAHSIELYLLIVAAGFLAIGLWLGARVIGAPAPPRDPGNPAAQAALGISARELEVLHHIAAGHANKEIARRMAISPNTVKTHAARLFEKLNARNRTDAIARARDLDLLA